MMLTDHALQRLLFSQLERGIEKGALYVTTPEKKGHLFGNKIPGHAAEWNIHDWRVVKALLSRGDIGLGETYMEAQWDSPNIDALLCVFTDNIDALSRLAHGNIFSRFAFRVLNHFIRRNTTRGSRNNIRAHYDVGNDFYRLWLDKSMTYSSALYTAPDRDLETAQKEKYHRILQHVESGRRSILEIGCGWGGFAEEAAKEGHHVTGLTISREQHDFAAERLGNSAEIRLEDYRHSRGTFDAIVSIEMFEAVGMQYWSHYFTTLKNRLAANGVAMVQTITIDENAFDDYVGRSDFIRHYVFPGGLLPSLERFKHAAERSGLVCRDVFLFGHDYARTLREWLQRFDAATLHARALGYSDIFLRSWRFYLALCAASFACGRTNVMQVELVKG